MPKALPDILKLQARIKQSVQFNKSKRNVLKSINLVVQPITEKTPKKIKIKTIKITQPITIVKKSSNMEIPPQEEPPSPCETPIRKFRYQRPS